MEQLKCCIPIPVAFDVFINHVTFDGCDYICTVSCRCEIIRFCPCGHSLHRHCTCREYDCICYDYGEHCFWASSRSCCGKLFKLDCSMNEVDCINICGSGQYGMITGISCNCGNDTLLVAFICTVIEIDKCGQKTNVLCTAEKYWIMDILSISPGLLLTVIKNGEYFIYIMDKCGAKIGCWSIDGTDIQKNLLFIPCESDCHHLTIQSFVLKQNCYPCLCKWTVSVDCLGYIPCCCNYRTCHECNCDAPCHSPCEDIMESIALIETALSHILNAEGEKIQKVLAITDDYDKIMCTNKEVNKTIVNATRLEQTLYAKLRTLANSNLCGNLLDNDCNVPGECCGD